MNRSALDRRRFLTLTGTATLASGAGLLLQACGGSAAPSSLAATPSGGAAAPPSGPPTLSPAGGIPSGPARAKPNEPFPTYIPFSPPGGIKPDFHDSDQRYDDGYNAYPANPFISWTKDPPGNGTNVVALSQAYTLPPTPYEQNATWHEVNKRLNANVQFNIIPGADYLAKLATLMAGNELPDIIHFYLGYAAGPNLPAFIKAKCADLTPYLSGDAAREYPNIAAIPTYAWRNSISALDGHLYLLPIHRYLGGTGPASYTGYFYKNTDMWDAVTGPNYVPKNADDFKRVMKELTRPQAGQYAIANNAGIEFLGLGGFLQMFKAPNGWRIDPGGKLTAARETEEFKAAVGYVRDLWAMEAYHPDVSLAPGSAGNDFAAGKFATVCQGFGNQFREILRRGLPAGRHFAFLPPIAHDGSKPINFLGPGYISTNALKAAPPERIKELLRIIDWLASPFGSQEDMLLSYGMEDQDYTLDDKGNPVTSQEGLARTQQVPWQYVLHLKSSSAAI